MNQRKDTTKNWYKPVSKITPVCVLSTVLLVGISNTAFAIKKTVTSKSHRQQEMTTSSNSESVFPEHFQDDLNDRLMLALSNRPEMFVYGEVLHPQPIDTSRPKLQGLQYEFAGPQGENRLNVNAEDVQDGDSKELVNFELLNYHNGGEVAQNYNTPEKTYTTTDSFTYSNQEGAKISVSETVDVEVGIPLIVDGKLKATISGEFSYNHTSTNTSQYTKMIKFPSQSITCIPGHTTIFRAYVKQVQFSGKNTLHARLIELQNLRISHYLSTSDSELGTVMGSISSAPGEEGRLVYNIFKYSGKPIPSYMKLDDTTHSIIVNDPGITMNFNGQLGYQENADLQVIPDDKSKPWVTIPYKTYIKQQQSGNMNKFIDDQIKNKLSGK